MLLRVFIFSLLAFQNINSQNNNDVLKNSIKSTDHKFNETIYQLIREDIEYTLYSMTHTYGKVFTYKDIDNYKPPNVVHSSIKVVIHGMIMNATAIDQFVADLMMHKNAIVIVVDWTNVNHRLLNNLQKKGPMYIANCIVEMLTNIFKNGIDSYDIHLIGHGLGAHIAGFTGRISQKYNVTLDRITGLDAVNPYFNNGLRKKDATFVDLINTSKVKTPRKLLENGSTGDADFYVNPEESQPMCIGHPKIQECNAMQAYEYFSDSIKHPKKYHGVRCMWKVVSENCCRGSSVTMGIDVNLEARGVYYVNSKKSSNRTKESLYELRHNSKFSSHECE